LKVQCYKFDAASIVSLLNSIFGGGGGRRGGIRTPNPHTLETCFHQFACFVSQVCGSYLKIGGLLFDNNEHNDASMAYVDPKFKLIGVFKAVGQYIESKQSIHSYFITTKGEPIKLEMVKENSQMHACI